MSLTTDPKNPDLGVPDESGMNKTYLVLSDEERAKGFVMPVRHTYVHDACGVATKMGQALSETYARNPEFYGSTFCCGCGTHFPVGEFKWDDGTTVGSRDNPVSNVGQCKCISWARTDGRLTNHHPNCSQFKEITYVKITHLEAQSSYVQEVGKLNVAFDGEFDGAEAGDKWELELVKMTVEEFLELPEFQGH